MRFIIGVGLIILGGVLGAVTGLWPFLVIMFVGVFLFASLPTNGSFTNYRIAGSDDFLVRKRHYIIFLPLHIVAQVLTLFQSSLLIPYKQEHFRLSHQEGATPVPISRQEYLTLRNQQRQIYSTQVLPRAFMEETYSPADIGLKHKKNRLVAAWVLAGLMLTMLTIPMGWALTLIYEAVFVPMIILWTPDYTDAKILQAAYDRSMNA